MKFLVWTKKKGQGMTQKLAQVTKTFMPFCPARGFNKTNPSIFFCTLHPGENRILPKMPPYENGLGLLENGFVCCWLTH